MKEKSEGNPLWAIEFCHSLREAGAIEMEGRTCHLKARQQQQHNNNNNNNNTAAAARAVVVAQASLDAIDFPSSQQQHTTTTTSQQHNTTTGVARRDRFSLIRRSADHLADGPTARYEPAAHEGAARLRLFIRANHVITDSFGYLNE